MQQSQSISNLAKALAAAQGEIKNAVKDNVNPHFKSKYADLASVMEACRGPLSKNGLAVAQSVGVQGEQVQVTTLLMHESGEFLSDSVPLAPWKTIQEMGSQITYLRRYSLSAMVGVAPDDDDGEASVRSDGQSAARNTQKPASAPAQQKPAEQKTPEQPTNGGTVDVKSESFLKMRAKINELAGFDTKWGSKDSVLAGVSAIIKRTITSSAELTPIECSTVIDALETELTMHRETARNTGGEF